MRRYNILQPILLAFYSKSLYRDVRQNWYGLVFAYLLLLVAICYLPSAYRIHNRINHFVHNLQPWFNQLPTITIHNEVVSIDKPVPYYIKNPDSGQLFAIIDTSNHITSLENTEAQILLTNKQLLIKKSEHSIKAYDVTGLRNQSFTAAEISRLANNIGHLLIFFIYPLIVALYFIQGILEALVYAALAKIFIRTPLPYNVLLRLAVIAITPKFILVTLLGLFSITIPYRWIFYFALGMGYLFFAIEANKQEKIAE